MLLTAHSTIQDAEVTRLRNALHEQEVVFREIKIYDLFIYIYNIKIREDDRKSHCPYFPDKKCWKNVPSFVCFFFLIMFYFFFSSPAPPGQIPLCPA